MRSGRLTLGLVPSLCVMAGVLALCLTTLAAPAGAAEGCENEARRVEQGSTFLPDCRAYELVSQPYQPVPAYRTYYDGFPPDGLTGFYNYGEEPDSLPEVQYGVSVAQDGDAALFESYQPNSESDSLRSNLSMRGASGWSGENVVPRVSRHGFLCDPAGYAGYSQDMEEVAISVGLGENSLSSVENCGHPEPELVPGESQESANLFLRDSTTHSFQLINVTPPGEKSYDPHLATVSNDGSHVVFLSRAQLTGNAPNGEIKDESETEGHCASGFGNVYEWIAGTVYLVTVLPDGTPVRGTLAGGRMYTCGTVPAQSADVTHAVSTDGERVVFYVGGGLETVSNSSGKLRPNGPYIDGGLYLREHPGAVQSAHSGSDECTEQEKACTVQIDAPEGGPGSAGDGQFQWASADTSKVFFTDEEKLTSDATAEAGRPDLYEYDLEKPVGERLTDLTANQSEAADVLGVSGASEDGSYVYFVADGVLTGSQENSHDAVAAAGQANLYLRHAGVTTFISTLDAEGGDQCDWTTWCLASRVSQNGLFIAFNSIASITGYDNHPIHAEACQHLTQVAEAPCIEAYRYAADAGSQGELTCATCNPTGQPPAAEFAWSVIEAADHEYEAGQIILDNAVSDTGQVFFETMEKLVSADENGTWDVYEYQGGEGASAQLHLISTGQSALPSFFNDATPDGSNVFFVTAQSLVHADDRSDYDLYDARAGGGFVAQDEEIQPPACESENGCRSPLTEPPAEFSVASASLAGAGNLVPTPEKPAAKEPAKCRKGSVRRHGKCEEERRRKHHRRHRHPRRAAHSHRRAGK